MDFHTVADDLQSLLVEVIELSLTSKQAHWSLGRPLANPLSAELDDLAADAWAWAEAVGARLVGMGIPPDGRAGTVARQVQFASFPVGFADTAEVVAPIVVRLNEIIENCPQRFETLGSSDPVSESLLVRVVSEMVKHRWVLASRESGESSPWDVGGPSGPMSSSLDPMPHSAPWRRGGVFGGR